MRNHRCGITGAEALVQNTNAENQFQISGDPEIDFRIKIRNPEIQISGFPKSVNWRFSKIAINVFVYFSN